jgi:hypothetical protein
MLKEAEDTANAVAPTVQLWDLSGTITHTKPSIVVVEKTGE